MRAVNNKNTGMVLKPQHEAIGMGIVLPYLCFLTQLFLWVYVYEYSPSIVYLVLFVVLMGCLWLRTKNVDTKKDWLNAGQYWRREPKLLEQAAGTGKHITEIPAPHSNLPFQSADRNGMWAIWILVVTVTGAFLGRSNFLGNRLPYKLTKEGNIYRNVVPFDSAVDKSDAGVIFFNKASAKLDVNIFRSYRYKGSNYCVAPVLTQGNTPERLLANYFAVGINCCSDNFESCLTSYSDDTLNLENVNDPKTVKAGIVLSAVDYAPEADPFSPSTGASELIFPYHGHRLWGNAHADSSQAIDSSPAATTGVFAIAGKMVVSYFGLQSGSNPVFMYYTADPEKYQVRRDAKVFGVFLFSSLVGLFGVVVGGVVIRNVQKRRGQ